MGDRLVNYKNYVTIQGWMVDELGLKGNELLIYAIIYGFSQTSEQEFNGSLQYLSEWTNSTRQGVIKNLKSLLDKNLIVKQEVHRGSVKYCTYKINETKFTGSKQSLTVDETKFNGTVKQSLHNNIVYNKVNNIDYIGELKFVPPTLEEVERYCKERNNLVDPVRFINHYQSNGWKVGKTSMKDWQACVRTWERNNYQSNPNNKPKSNEPTIRYKSIEDWLGEINGD